MRLFPVPYGEGICKREGDLLLTKQEVRKPLEGPHQKTEKLPQVKLGGYNIFLKKKYRRTLKTRIKKMIDF